MAQMIRKSDAALQEDVLQELRWDTRVKETDVGVGVANGVVTLTGTLTSWASRLAAQQAAHRVAGVLDVANELHVRLPGLLEKDDADVARAVRQALEWDVFVPDERIRTTVSNGVVTLEGKVAFWSQYDDAARAVRNLSGVREVRNQIGVEPAPVAPETVRIAIGGALERHAKHAANHIQIAIADGTVTLAGQVPSWADRNAVEGAVRGTPGVRRVDNRLTIHE